MGDRILSGTGRICVVGFQKTGTTSVTRALRQLEYSVGYVAEAANQALAARPDDPRAALAATLVEHLQTRDAIQDSPTAFFYKDLDRAFPGSKFINTVRDPDAWLKSFAGYFPNRMNRLRAWMYGLDRVEGNEDALRGVYVRQTAEIRAYFAGRDDYLELDLAAGEGWYELVTFLGRDFLPPFPRVQPPGGRAGRNFGARKRRQDKPAAEGAIR